MQDAERRKRLAMYSLLLILIYIAFISLGLPDSLVGSGWPAMHADLGVPVSYMGIVTMIISGGTIVSSLLSEKLTKKFGTRHVTVVSVFLTAAAMLGFSFADRFWMLLLFGVPYGLGAGAIDAALNNYIALHYKARHMNWLHCFWGVGTIVSPFVMSHALSHANWQGGFRIIGLVQLGIALLLLCTLPVWKIHSRTEEAGGEKVLGLRGALRIRGVPLLLIGFFAYCAAEATAMNWASTYFAEVKGVADEQAAQFASLFYIGITSSRFLCGFLSDKLGDRKMILAGATVLLGGIVLLLIPAPNALAIAGFVIIGFGCGPVYPSIVHSTPDNFGAENSGAIIGIQMASAYVGSTFIPPLFGLLGRALGFAVLPFFLLVFLFLMITMTELTFRIAKKAPHTQP